MLVIAGGVILGQFGWYVVGLFFRAVDAAFRAQEDRVREQGRR